MSSPARPDHADSARRLGLALLAAGVLVAGCGAEGSTPEGSTSPNASTTSAGPAGAAPAPDSSGTTSGAASTDGDTLAGVQERGTLRVCTTGDYRPYTYLDPDTGEWSGIDVALTRDLADSLAVDQELVRVTWDDLVRALETGGCDLAAGGVSFTPEREEVVDFSEPTVQDGKAPITTCERVEEFQSIEDIDRPGVRVITPVGGTNEAFADEQFPDAEIIRWDDNNTIFDQILAGEADVMVTDASETRWVAHENEGELCAVNPDDPFTTFENGYLLPQDDQTWKATVDAWLLQAKEDGTYADAEEPWYG